MLRAEVFARLARWWGNRHGYVGREGGWVYVSTGKYDRVFCQGWYRFYQLRWRSIAASGDRPKRGQIRQAFDETVARREAEKS